MIQSLHIQNYAIIEKLDVRFQEGLNILTGETGAGKSIIIGALNLILGQRADTKVLFDQEKKCIVEGIFNIKSDRLNKILIDNDLDVEDLLTIRREINTKGKSRAFVNDTPTTLSVLNDMTDHIIDLHQQFATLDIHSRSFQLQILDAVANNQALLQSYQESFKAYKNISKELQKLRQEHQQQQQNLDYLRFQIEEFDTMRLQPGEQEDKENQLKNMNNAEDIHLLVSNMEGTLIDGDHSILNILRGYNKSLMKFGTHDETFKTNHEKVEGIMEDLENIYKELRNKAEDIEFSPAAIEKLDNRLSDIYRMQKKHGVSTVEELIGIHEKFRQQMNGISQNESAISDLETKLTTLHSQTLEIAIELTASRKKVMKSTEIQITDLLSELAMPNARFQIEHALTKELGENGQDEIDFTFSANAGSPLQPIKNVASGGELSRLNLSIKSLVADKMELSTLVFDEIDMGISGEVAVKMAKILTNLAKSHQIISITHSPQIAARASHHLHIYKTTRDNQTISSIKVLSMDERITEIAKMLSGDPPSTHAIANAKELIG